MHYLLPLKTFDEAFEVHARLQDIGFFQMDLSIRIIVEAAVVKSETTEGKIQGCEIENKEFYSKSMYICQMESSLKSLVDEIALMGVRNKKCELKAILILIDTGELPLECLKGIYNTEIQAAPDNSYYKPPEFLSDEEKSNRRCKLIAIDPKNPAPSGLFNPHKFWLQNFFKKKLKLF